MQEINKEAARITRQKPVSRVTDVMEKALVSVVQSRILSRDFREVTKILETAQIKINMPKSQQGLWGLLKEMSDTQ